MEYYSQYPHDPMFDPTCFYETPLVQDLDTIWLDFGLLSDQYPSLAELEFNPPLSQPDYANFTFDASAALSTPQVNQGNTGLSPELRFGEGAYLHGLGEEVDAVLVDLLATAEHAFNTYDAYPNLGGSPSSEDTSYRGSNSPVDLDEEDYAHSDASSSPSPPPIRVLTAGGLKRKASDTDTVSSAASSASASSPSPSKRRRAHPSPLPAHLQPIRVSSAAPLVCPIPGCATQLPSKDSAWRAHFKRAHHAALCVSCPSAPHSPTSDCRARCPDASCCAGEGDGEMSIESVGRHWLNVHIGVAFRCPVCGVESKWRESACARHARRCAEKHATRRERRAVGY